MANDKPIWAIHELLRRMQHNYFHSSVQTDTRQALRRIDWIENKLESMKQDPRIDAGNGDVIEDKLIIERNNTIEEVQKMMGFKEQK